MKTKNNTKSRFWLIYGVVTCIAVIIAAVFFAVFYDIMAAYEESQPQTSVEEFAATLSAEKIEEMSAEAVSKLNLKYENSETYTEIFNDAFNTDNMICRKLLTESTADTPVFSLICNDTEVVRLYLNKADGGKYGFDKWSVSSVEIPLDGIIQGGKDYTLYTPHGSTLSVNGITPEAESENIAHPMASGLEEYALPSCDRYELGTLYSPPDLICISEGTGCIPFEYEGDLIYSSSNINAADYKISAPTGAKVYVNGILLDEKYVTDNNVPYEYSSLESNAAGLPTYTVYNTGELFTSPTITAELDEKKLNAETDGTSCVFNYPADMTYSLTVKVPTGSKVSIDGIDPSEIAEVCEESAYNGLDLNGADLPMLDVYKINGLFTKAHEITATLNGTSLALRDESTGNSIIYSADYTAVIDTAVSEFALEFIGAYFHYTSQGYNNTDENLAAALTYVAVGSELYDRIEKSKIGYDFVTPVTSEIYRRLDVSHMYRLEDGTYAVKIVFDVDQTIVYVNRTYKGEISLHITGNGDGMKIRDMVIVSE